MRVQQRFSSLTDYIAPASHVDDEYARAGLTDPKIFITTSRDPSSRLVQFSKVKIRHLYFIIISVATNMI